MCLEEGTRGAVNERTNNVRPGRSHTNVPMKEHAPTPREKEIQRLHAKGKSPEMIAIRLGMKISKVLLVLSMVPKSPL